MNKSLPKLLAVDDQPKNLHALRRLLDSTEIELVEVQSGEEALQAVLENDFFLILMDVQMPVLNGFETAQLILQNKTTSSIPIIFVTAISKSEKFAISGYESGAVDYLHKPLDPQILRGKVAVFRDLWLTQNDLQNTNKLLEEKELALIEQIAAAETAEANVSMLLNSVAEGVVGIDLKGDISFANPKACSLLHIDHAAILESNITDFMTTEENSDAENEKYLQLMQILTPDQQSNEQDRYWQTAAGESFAVEYSCNRVVEDDGQRNRAVIAFQNVSGRKALEQRLTRMANYDELTGVANRSFFHATLQNAMQRQKRSCSMLAVLFVDLDDFKPVNDTWGHGAGDQLLKEVARRINRNRREGDLVARLGGDEFVVVVFDIAGSESVGIVAEEILAEMSRPFALDSGEVSISASIGSSWYSSGEISKDDLLQQADAAMYQAKESGRNCWRAYSAIPAAPEDQPTSDQQRGKESPESSKSGLTI